MILFLGKQWLDAPSISVSIILYEHITIKLLPRIIKRILIGKSIFSTVMNKRKRRRCSIYWGRWWGFKSSYGGTKDRGLPKQSTRRSMTSASCREEFRITAPTTQCDKFQEGASTSLFSSASSSLPWDSRRGDETTPVPLSLRSSVDSTFSTVGPDMYGVHGKNPAS